MAVEKIQSALPPGPAGTSGAAEGPDGTLHYNDISGKDLGAVAGDNGGPALDDVDLSGGLVPKQAAGDDVDLTGGLVPKTAATPPARQGATGITGVLSGIGGEVMETAQGAKELVNHVLPTGMQIPDIPKEYRENTTPSEKIGGFAESLGEFVTGEELLKGLTNFAKVEKLAAKSPTIAKFISETPDFLKRIVSGGAKAAAVGAAQGGVKGAAEGDAKGGAEGGAIGGAVGGTAGEVLGSVAKPIANKLGIATSAEEDAMKAFQPGKRENNFLANWATAKDRIVESVGEDGKFKDWTDAADRLREVRQDLWKTEVKPKIDAHAGEDMFSGATGNPVADAIRARITPAMEKVSPRSAKAIETFAKRFDGPMKVGEAEDLAEHLNAELADSGYFAKSAKERAAADKANPALASRSAAVDAIRNGLADHLEAAGETGIKDLKKEYGAISALEDHARGRINVDGRARPISLKQMLGAGMGIAHGGVAGAAMGLAVPLLDKMYNDPIALLNRSFAKAEPGMVRTVANKVAGAAIDAAPTAGANLGSQAGQAAATIHTGTGPTQPSGEQWIKFRSSNGVEFEGHPDDWDKIKAADPGATQTQ